MPTSSQHLFSHQPSQTTTYVFRSELLTFRYDKVEQVDMSQMNFQKCRSTATRPAGGTNITTDRRHDDFDWQAAAAATGHLSPPQLRHMQPTTPRVAGFVAPTLSSTLTCTQNSGQ